MLALLFRNPLLILAAVVGLALGGTLGVTVGKWTGVQIGREQGTSAERLVWQERQRRAEIAAREAQQATQAEIDRIEADYHQRDQSRAADMAELERALQDEKTDATPIPTPSPGAACACRPAVSRAVRDQLDRIGRPAARSPAAVPDAAVPGGR